MIETILNILKMLVAILPFIIFCFTSASANLHKKERSRQFAMPIIALIYVILCMLLLDPINDWLIKLIRNIPLWIAGLAGFSWMPAFLQTFFKWLAGGIADIIRALNLNFWVFFIANTVIMILFLMIKKISIAIIRKAVKPDGAVHTKIASVFYRFFFERDFWCLKDGYSQVRNFLKTFYYSTVAISGILMIVSAEMFKKELLLTPFYPVFGILIMGELFYYLDGLTKGEYGSIMGEDDEAYRIVNYSMLRKFLRNLFKDKLLSENTSINNALAYNVTTDEIIRKLEKDEDPKVVCFASYIDALNKTGYRIDHNYLHSSLDMLSGKSILFNNPFYNDLVPYIFYPMNRVLLSHQKVLVVLGRHAIEDDIKAWIEKGVESITNIPFMWNVGVLTKEEQELDIGIVTRSDVLDMELHNANSKFLEDVGFCVIIEPSKLISTAQIGLNLLVKKCKTEEDKNIVYCMCDKNCDGLVDAMSHILMTSITEVSATRKHLGTSSYMCWEADGDYLHHRLLPNISRYLGMGTELSFAALKNQVAKTKWYGGEAFPVTDIRWIDKQYYYDLTKYAGLPTSPEAMDEQFILTSNFWSAEVEDHNYMTVEDESFNMFEVLRDFSTRTTEQGFINVISSEYLLKDYMADNASIFEADAKAIPYIVADYTRSRRNTILRLVLMMSTFPVGADTLSKELSLLGISVFELKKQLWYELYHCYSEVSEIAKLPDDYRTAVERAFSKAIILKDTQAKEANEPLEWTNELIKEETSFNLKLGRMETTYSIVDPQFLAVCVAELRSASYVAEDEKGHRYYLGAELGGHIYQKYLPGQFFTFGGKYYEMQYLTADGQILVRRAADHITGRPGYRQIREYTIHGIKPSEQIGSRRDVAGMKVIREFADITVDTTGYYRMEKYNDFSTAKRILFEGDNHAIRRTYHNKEILRIELPDFEGKLTNQIRYTITLMFNEIFKTIFAENQGYICALTDETFLAETEEVKPLTYSLKSEGCPLSDRAIYIVEDSQLDLGLTVAVERNLQRIFDMIQDYLEWHMETLEASLNPPPEPQPPIIFGTDTEGEEAGKKKKGIFGKLGEGIKKLIEKIKGRFKKKPKKGEEPAGGETPEEEPDGTPVPPTDDPIGETPAEGDGVTPVEGDGVTPAEGETPSEETKEKKKGWWAKLRERLKKKKKPTAEEAVDGEIPEGEIPESEIPESEIPEGEIPEPEIPEGEIPQEPSEELPIEGEQPADDTPQDPKEQVNAPYESESEEGPTQAEKMDFLPERKPYHERYYMLYGRECEYAFIDLGGTLEYFEGIGNKRNALKQARDGKKIAAFIEATYKPGKPDSRYCDFCGTEIFGVEYETLADGRDRCLQCSRTAIKSEEEFKKIFADVKRNMESFFGIRINVGIRVEMVNARTLHKRLGEAFIPTPRSDGRILGVAIRDKNGYSLYVENGSPRMASMLTMAHELTHIWQYVNWDDRAIRKKYGKNMRLEIYEGMAKWVEIQYAYLINEPATAKREEIITSYREDEYGRGFLRYRANYPFSTGTIITKRTPFMDVDTPLDPEYCGSFTVVMPTDGINPGDLEGGDGTTPISGTEKPIPADPIKGPVERDPQKLNRYAYSLLDDAEKAIYDKVAAAIENYEPEVVLEAGASNVDQNQKILKFVRRDHPEYFWCQYGVRFTDDKILLNYCMPVEEVQKRSQQIDVAVKPFMSGIHNTMSDYEVVLRVYENIIKLVDYDTIGLERQERNPSDDGPDDLRSIYGVFVNKKAVCAGYAKAMQYLLNLCGIECLYVTSATHAWNVVKLEGDYYHLDVTWGDGSDTKKTKPQSNEISYDCFCMTTEEVERLEHHKAEADFPIPTCTATKCNYFRRHGLYFENYDLDKIRSIVCECVKHNRLTIPFKFASPAVYKEAERRLNGGEFRDLIRYATLKTNVKLSLSYAHSPREEKNILVFYLTKL